VLFISLGIIWGLPYMLIKIAVREISPELLVFLRTAGGALLLSPIVIFRKEFRGLLKHWLPLVLYTTVELGIPWFVLFRAEERLSSSLTGLLIAAVPLAGAVLALATGTDHLGSRRLAGLLLGFGGVAALVGFDVGHSDLLSAASLLLVVIGYAVGPWILAHYLADQPPMAVVAASLLLAAVVYGPLAAFHLPTGPLSASVIESVIVLTVVCTVIAFLVFFALIEEVGPMRATVVTYVNPAVAVFLGVVVLGEKFTIATAVGFVLILGGSYLATSRVSVPATDEEVAAVEAASGVTGMPAPETSAVGEV
jgi:drug/metabolite transporter (DMT)-like permease